MPLFTLYSLFPPAVSGIGHTRIMMRSALLGAVVMPLAFLAGIQWGAAGLAWAWVLAFPAVPLFAFLQSRGPLGLTAGKMIAAVAPGLGASALMALLVSAAGLALDGLESWQRLPLLVAVGGAAYVATLYATSRQTLHEVIELVARRRKPAEA
jgi:hypothetical protein